MTDTVRVPREPTEAMIEAGFRAREHGMTMEQDARAIYRAMLAASPQGEGSSAEGARTLRFTVDRLDLETMTMKPHIVEIVGPTPPAMSADHIGDAGNMVAPVKAVAWRFWHEGGWNFSLADPSPHLADCVERDALYTHPAPIKPSGDTGELRDRVARVIHPKPWSEDYELADAILDLIQSERAG